VTAATRLENAIVAIAKKRVVVRIRFDDDVAAVAAIAAGRAASWDVLLPTKRDGTIAAIARFHRNFGFVSKHESDLLPWTGRKAYASKVGKDKNTRPGSGARIGNVDSAD
jgi:hypothetical protein